MRDLPRSVYATPGMVGMGQAKIVPNEKAEGLEGMVVAHVARTAAMAKVRAPCFGFLTSKKGNEDYRAPVYVHAILHPPGAPDVLCMYMNHVLDKEDMDKYYNLQALFKSDVEAKAAFDALDDDSLILDREWDGVGSFVTFEPSIHVKRNGDVLGADRDAVKLGAIHHRCPWRTKGYNRLQLLDDILPTEWEAADLHNKLAANDFYKVAAAVRPPPLEPMPPSGLAPRSASFEVVAPDVMLIKGKFVPVGATPGRLSHAIEYKEDNVLRIAVPVAAARPGDPIRAREAFTQAELATTEYVLPAACHLDDYELVLGDEEIEISPDAFVRTILIVPDQAYALARLDVADAVRTMPLVVADGAIKAIEEPVTEASYRADFADFYLARNGGENGSTLDLVRNECRMQMTPELQQNLAQATVTIPGFGFARFLGMSRGREAEWLGDREQTYRYELLPDEMGELWKPGLPNGWVVPELPPTKRGRKRQRRANRRGFMLVMTHADEDGSESNYMQYCAETNLFTLVLALGFYNENLVFRDGVPPPPCDDPDLEFDIVTREWVDRANARTPVWTERRARDHFGEA